MRSLLGLLGLASNREIKTLRKFNLLAAVLYFLQAVVILVFSNDHRSPLTTDFLANSQSAGGLEAASQRVTDIPLVLLIAMFLLISAAAHFLVATIYRNRYESNLAHGVNKARWVEYALSVSLMAVVVAMLVGVSDISTLVLIMVAVSVAKLSGLAAEVWRRVTGKTSWPLYWICFVLSGVPGLIYIVYLWGGSVYGNARLPGHVYAIFGTMTLLFLAFAINAWLRNKQSGRWADNVYVERSYIILSMLAKSTLAWQIFAGVLVK